MGTWRNISHLGLPYLISGRATQAYLNGAAHWIGVDRERQCMMFVSFRMADESFHSMSLPAGIGEGVQSLIGFPREGELLIEARGDLISFRLRDVQVKGLGIHNNTGDWYKESLHTEAYVGSLVLLGSPEQTMEDEVACQEEKENMICVICSACLVGLWRDSRINVRKQRKVEKGNLQAKKLCSEPFHPRFIYRSEIEKN
ncbi:hypothetical protein RHMOL_Rhmol06G0165500 [Rhododendron molle]|uniref:Uncharacterized protein n=1 Tax=Rhododendron molle TaxID=49168 RepID=A0ACC0NDA2_RHOML|nr:hypothetical protein RHMOL_Rhmol06G0165500 [Rhododendron molle]